MTTKPAQIPSGSGHGRHDSSSRFSIARLIGSHRRGRSASAESVVVEDGDRTNTKDTKEKQALDDLELRRHVRAVAMGDERPLPIPAPARALERHRHSADLG
jgi:Ribonuclease G/E